MKNCKYDGNDSYFLYKTDIESINECDFTFNYAFNVFNILPNFAT